MTNTLTEIETQTKRYADTYDSLAEVIGNLNERIEQLKRSYMPEIRLTVRRTTEQRDKLSGMIEQNPSLFEKPRTVTFHGVKIGFRKGNGKIEFEDEDRVVALIEKHFPDRAADLVKTEKSPIKKALAGLTVAELKKIGCTAEESGDIVVIAHTDSEVAKVVNALIKAQPVEEIKEAA